MAERDGGRGGGVVTQEEVKGIFSELKVIYLYNQTFLSDLLQRKAEVCGCGHYST